MRGWRKPVLAVTAAVVLGLVGVLAIVRARDDGDSLETTDETTTTDGTTTTDRATSSSSSTTASSTTVPSTTATTAPAGSSPGTGGGSPPPTPPAPPADPLAGVRIRAAKVANADYPIAMAVRPSDGSVWIARKAGFVCRLAAGGCTADVKVADVSSGSEQGLLGLTFNTAGNRLFLSYTDPAGDTRVDVRPTATSGGLGLGAPTPIFGQNQPEANHNGGNIVTGPDGFLYLGLGDGGGSGDQHGSTGNGQNPNTNLGKLLRINPTTYAVQRWVSGVRNPWRFSFDRSTGDLWVGDVGQNQYEEIDLLRSGAQAGRNLGWRCYEATHVYASCSPQTPSGYVGPIFEYGHGPGCSVTGGYAYRGSRIPSLRGIYLFADYCDGELRAIAQQGGRLTAQRRLGVDVGNVVSFGQDGQGELYVLTPSAIFRIDPA